MSAFWLCVCVAVRPALGRRRHGLSLIIKGLAPDINRAEPRSINRRRFANGSAVFMSRTVLLVEDDERLGVLYELVLGEAGYRVAWARNGAEALSRLTPKSPPVDVVVTDINLGVGPNGWQVARRAQARSPDLPVIYMTGARGDEWLPQHVPLGVLLLKPFPVQQLVDMVAHLLAARAESRQAQRRA
jgi:DNA-binding NtrC family response regulator